MTLFVNSLQGKVLSGAMVPAEEPEMQVEEVEQHENISNPMTKTHMTSLGKFKLTAYCPCRECSGGYGRQTSTGHRAKSRHTVAVDPRNIRYGTKLIIDGTTYTAEDCGGGVKGRHIDIFFNTHSEVERFGKRYREVSIYE